MPKKPKRQNPPERPKALRRASLIEIAAANQDEFDKNKGGILTLSENRSPIHVQKMKEKELLEEGKAAKEFKRCRPVVEMMAHAFTEPDAASRSKLFGEELFPRVPVSEEGHREIRDIKDCHGLTEDDEPGFYNYKDGVFLGDTNKRGVKLLTPLRDIETMDDHMDDQAWRDAMQARMAKFHAKLNQGQGPGWEQFWHIQKEREEMKGGNRGMRGKWKKRYRFAKGKLGCYSSKEIGLTADDGGEIAWGKRTVVNVAEVLSSDDDGNGWGRTVMEFIEHCRAKGFDMGEKTNWRSLGADTGKGPQGPPGVLERTASPTSLHKGQEWVLTAVKNPGRLSITYRVEARLMKEMAQDMSGSYRSFIKVTCRADSVLAVLDPFFMRCHFGSFTKDLNRKLAELPPAPIRRSSNAGLPSPLAQRDQQTLQATPAPPTEQKIGTGGSRKESAATAAEADPTPEADVEVVPEVAAVSSEQLSAQEGGPGVPKSPMPGSMDAQP